MNIEKLSSLDLFKNVSIESVASLLELCEFVDIEAGETLLFAGENNSTLYILLEGELTVRLKDGDSEQLFKLEAGETVGEMSVLDGAKTSADVIAKKDSNLFAIGQEEFWCLIDVSHEFAKNLLMGFSKRIRKNNMVIRDSVQLRDRFERESKIDPLTGLRNRRWLDDNLPKLLKRLEFDKNSLSLIMIDIDHFKAVNDDYGHLVGDEVLASVAYEITNSLRPTDFGCRYGGEEFIAILPNSDSEGSSVAAERLRVGVETVFKTLNREKNLPAITISLGVATSSGEGILPEQLIKLADDALYAAKDGGRNRVVRAAEI